MEKVHESRKWTKKKKDRENEDEDGPPVRSSVLFQASDEEKEIGWHNSGSPVTAWVLKCKMRYETLLSTVFACLSIRILLETCWVPFQG